MPTELSPRMKVEIFSDFRAFRLWRLFFVGLGVGINLLGFLLVYIYGLPIDMGMLPLDPAPQWHFDIGRLLVMLASVAWWSGPLLVYLGLAQSKLGSIVFGLLISLAFLWVWGDLLTETSSTVGIGILLWPPYLYVGIAGTCILDAALIRFARRQRNHPSAPSEPTRISDPDNVRSDS
jgi:hypothetical protein